MDKVDGGELLMRVFDRAGIRTIFTLHGGHLDAIYQAARERDVRLVDTRHEQAAGHAADGWARTTGQPGVAIVTAGPGVTDCTTAIANAYLDCVPTLFIGGAAPLRDAETLPLQGGLDQVAMLTPITKWAHRITHTHRIRSWSRRPAHGGVEAAGPVFLEIPIDVLFARIDGSAPFPQNLPDERLTPSRPRSAAKAIGWLRAAERPAIFAGGGRGSRARSANCRLRRAHRHPGVLGRRAHGMVPADHALCGRGSARCRGRRWARRGSSCSCSARGSDSSPEDAARRCCRAARRSSRSTFRRGDRTRNRDVDLGIAADVLETLRAFRGGGRPRPSARPGDTVQARASDTTRCSRRRCSRSRRRSIRTGSRPTSRRCSRTPSSPPTAARRRRGWR
jgi:acetolactate synthase-1/2/3 large subunit